MDEFIKENENVEQTVENEVVKEVEETTENSQNIEEPVVVETEISQNTEEVEFKEETVQTETTESFEVEAPQQPPVNEFVENEFVPVYNTVKYSAVEPMKDYKPMSKGLKIFAGIMAAIVLLTGTCYAGYVVGKNSVGVKRVKANTVNLAAAPKDTDELTPAQVYEKVDKSIVGIRIYNESGTGGQASGIIYSDNGYIVTNDHIYAEIPAAKFRVYMSDGKEYDAKYVAGDKVSDLAVLKIEASKLEVAVFGNSDDLYYGQSVVAIGRPSAATDPSSITRGVISALDRRVQTTSNYSSRLIQTDSAINPGSSGGALVNMYGQVVGVTSSKLASVEYDAVGYAIPTTLMKRIVDELIDKGKVVSRAKLGITYMAVDSVIAELNDYETEGLLIDSVAEDSGLYGKAKKGDFITHINDIEVTSDTIVLDIIENSRAGDKINVTIYSSGKTKTVEAVLKANVSESSYTLTETESNKIEPNQGSQNGGFGGNGNGGSNGNNGGNGGGTFDFPFGE